MTSETVHLDGHIIDSQTLSRVLDVILLQGGTYEITTFQIGTKREEPSHAEIVVRTEDTETLHRILQDIGQLGATSPAHEARAEPAPADGVFPQDFYSTTNLESFVRMRGQWTPIEQIEMDCGVVLDPEGEAARCHPHGRSWPPGGLDRIVVGAGRGRVSSRRRPGPPLQSLFEFMTSAVSSEKPKGVTVRLRSPPPCAALPGRREAAPAALGPAVVHTGSVEHISCKLISRGLPQRPVCW